MTNVYNLFSNEQLVGAPTRYDIDQHTRAAELLDVMEMYDVDARTARQLLDTKLQGQPSD